MKLGTRVMIVKTKCGCMGAESKIGIVTNKKVQTVY